MRLVFKWLVETFDLNWNRVSHDWITSLMLSELGYSGIAHKEIDNIFSNDDHGYINQWFCFSEHFLYITFKRKLNFQYVSNSDILCPSSAPFQNYHALIVYRQTGTQADNPVHILSSAEKKIIHKPLQAPLASDSIRLVIQSWVQIPFQVEVFRIL